MKDPKVTENLVKRNFLMDLNRRHIGHIALIAVHQNIHFNAGNFSGGVRRKINRFPKTA